MPVYHSAVHLRVIQNHTECKVIENKQTVQVLRNHCAALTSAVRLGKVPHRVGVERRLSVTRTPSTLQDGISELLEQLGGCALSHWFRGYLGEYPRQPLHAAGSRACGSAHAPDPRSSQRPSRLELGLPGASACQEDHPELGLSRQTSPLASCEPGCCEPASGSSGCPGRTTALT